MYSRWYVRAYAVRSCVLVNATLPASWPRVGGRRRVARQQLNCAHHRGKSASVQVIFVYRETDYPRKLNGIRNWIRFRLECWLSLCSSSGGKMVTYACLLKCSTCVKVVVVALVGGTKSDSEIVFFRNGDSEIIERERPRDRLPQRAIGSRPCDRPLGHEMINGKIFWSYSIFQSLPSVKQKSGKILFSNQTTRWISA